MSNIILKIGNMEIDFEDARKLYEELKKVFEPTVVTYPQYPSPGVFPWPVTYPSVQPLIIGPPNDTGTVFPKAPYTVTCVNSTANGEQDNGKG